MLVSRRARVERFPWPVHLDEFRLAGRVVRPGRPDVWIYEHHDNGGSVCGDAAGDNYRFVAPPRAGGRGQFRPGDLRTALLRARFIFAALLLMLHWAAPSIGPLDPLPKPSDSVPAFSSGHSVAPAGTLPRATSRVRGAKGAPRC